MPKDLLSRHYQKTHKGCEKKLVNDIKIFLKKGKAKSQNMVAENVKGQYLSIEKNIIK